MHHWAEYKQTGRVTGDAKVRLSYMPQTFADYVADVCRGINIERSPFSLPPEKYPGPIQMPGQLNGQR